MRVALSFEDDPQIRVDSGDLSLRKNARNSENAFGSASIRQLDRVHDLVRWPAFVKKAAHEIDFIDHHLAEF